MNKRHFDLQISHHADKSPSLVTYHILWGHHTVCHTLPQSPRVPRSLHHQTPTPLCQRPSFHTYLYTQLVLTRATTQESSELMRYLSLIRCPSLNPGMPFSTMNIVMSFRAYASHTSYLSVGSFCDLFYRSSVSSHLTSSSIYQEHIAQFSIVYRAYTNTAQY